jgi:FkbM family methyltransferase
VHPLLRTARSVPTTLRRAARWPVYSRTSSAMVASLVAQGIRPPLVIDVGANKGQFAVAALELVPGSRVVSFEPLPSQHEGLRALQRRYGDRFELRPVALGAEPATLTLQVNRHHQSSSLLPLGEAHRRAFPQATVAEQVQVPVERLADQFDPATLPAGTLLKLDVQGFEREVLAGAGEVLAACTHVIAEASLRPLYDGEWTFTELLDEMARCGFRFLRPVGHLADPATGEYLQLDALFSRD